MLFSGATVQYVTAFTSRTPSGDWSLKCDVYLFAPQGDTGSVTVTLFDSVNNSIVISQATQKTSGSGDFKVTVDIPLDSVQISEWNPVGFGLPTRYPLKAHFTSDSKAVPDAPKEIFIGFREVELIQDPLPGGTSFYFRVNGRKVWAKGANWIPADAFSSRVTSLNVLSLFQSFLDANMNMIRVWGGGIYQPDWFYSLADTLGLLVRRICVCMSVFAVHVYIFFCSELATFSSFLSHTYLPLLSPPPSGVGGVHVRMRHVPYRSRLPLLRHAGDTSSGTIDLD